MNQKKKPKKGHGEALPKIKSKASSLPKEQPKIKTFDEQIKENRLMLEKHLQLSKDALELSKIHSLQVKEFCSRVEAFSARAKPPISPEQPKVHHEPICEKCTRKRECLIYSFPYKIKHEICPVFIDAAKKQIELVKKPSNLTINEMLDFILEHKN